MHSRVREASGIGFTGSAYAESFVLADVRMDWRLPADEVMLYFAPVGLVVIAPLPGGRHRIVATLDQAPEHPSAADVRSLWTPTARGGSRTGCAAVVALTDRMTRLATLRSRPLVAARNLVLPAVGGLPFVRQGLAMKLAELSGK